uniref:N-acylethanolamine-hydrolyzing acid amidase-like n=1 Tax=Styela clava TaxID=7725 RepID=UPI00193A68BE|nr:N-acylethanolamine-hydrolyzing acid amidase-like [Styela clava]
MYWEKKITCILLLFDLTAAESFHGSTGKRAVPAPNFVVNLDLPPAHRWDDVLKHFDRRALIDSYNIIFKLFEDTEIWKIVEKLSDNIYEHIPKTYAEEITGISKFLGVDAKMILLLNLVYDADAFGSSTGKACTSIVAMNTKGEIFHGRNLDFYPFVRNMTIDVEFQHNGKTLYEVTTVVGYVGVLTATKFGKFSLSADERDYGGWQKNVQFASNGSMPTLLLARQVLEKANDYENAISLLMTAATIAPIYFIVGGVETGNGAIVTRDRWGGINVTRMRDKTHNRWFIVETNYDPWKSPPAKDDRRDAVIEYMNENGQENINADTLYEVLSTSPIFREITVHTTIMSAQDKNVYRTMIRYDAPEKDDFLDDILL